MSGWDIPIGFGIGGILNFGGLDLDVLNFRILVDRIWM